MKIPPWPSYDKSNIIKYNLDNITNLLQAIGNPHLKLPPVIHIAGTNGKGSSSAMLSKIFKLAGYKVHMYTSPHLIEFNERIIVSGKKITDEYLIDISNRVRDAASKANLEPSFFEATTAMAMLAFAENHADIVILETGLGGRLDATNIIPNPLAVLITSISYDHTEFLGDAIESIAAEKAEIIKPGAICVIGKQENQEIVPILRAKCEECGVDPIIYGNKVIAQVLDYDNTYMICQTRWLNRFMSRPALPGDHQVFNAAAVLALIDEINNTGIFEIRDAAISNGIFMAKWPGRLEKLPQATHGFENINLWVDGAHNVSGAKSLVDWIKDYTKGPTYLIMGMLKNRDPAEFVEILKERVEGIYAVGIKSVDNGFTANELKEKIEKVAPCIASGSVKDSLSDIAQKKGAKKLNVVVCGSLYLVGDFSSLL